MDWMIVSVALLSFVVLIVGLMVIPERRTAVHMSETPAVAS